MFAPYDLTDVLAMRPFSDAEWHLWVGYAVRACLRQGLSLPVIAKTAQITPEDCLLSLKFAEASTGLKFQALVEEWPWSRIAAALAVKESEDARHKLANAQNAGQLPKAARPQR